METRVEKGEKNSGGLLGQAAAGPASTAAGDSGRADWHEAKQRLRLYGPNSMAQESRFAGLLAFLRFFANPLVIILLVASGISLGWGTMSAG